MPLVKNSDEAKTFMERVRNAKQNTKLNLPPQPVLKEVKEVKEATIVEEQELELPKDKFLLLLNIIMELQQDIDYLIEAHRQLKD